jgi:heme/copper-type cytochrome/quinol oxidase subunit 3
MSDVPQNSAAVSLRDTPKLAVWVFLGGEVVFFATLILTFIMYRLQHVSDYGSFTSHLSIPLIGANTFVLIASSFMVVNSLEAIREGNQTGLRNNMIAVVVLGAIFLGGQAFEWATLFREGVNLASTFGTPFFTVTGIHGTHVFVGLIWAIIVLVNNRRGAFTEHRHLGVELFGLYWHFVDIVWIVLFTVIYLI